MEWIIPRDNAIHSNGKRINQIDINTGEIIKTFRTIIDACIFFKIKYNSNIVRCCRGKQKSAYGYKWEYVKNGTILNQINIGLN